VRSRSDEASRAVVSPVGLTLETGSASASPLVGAHQAKAARMVPVARAVIGVVVPRRPAVARGVVPGAASDHPPGSVVGTDGIHNARGIARVPIPDALPHVTGHVV
jgi:hypothetical protein